MKKFHQNNDKKALSASLFKNYIVISVLLVFVLIASLFMSDFLLDIILFNGIKLQNIDAEDIYSYPFETMNTEVLDVYGGWYEILDKDRKVVYVKGEKKDGIYQYTNEMLFNKMDLSSKLNDNMIYHVYPIEDSNGEKYLILWKQPNNLLNKATKVALILVFIIFSILLLIALYFYSVYSVRQIKKPLKSIIHGIKEMERQNYKVRLDFMAEKEFAEIRDAFNKMAKQIQQSETEKEKVEQDKKKMLLHLSHDLNTPITSIYGFSKLLYDEEICEEKDRRKYLKYIYDKSSYVANLIKDLFEFAKLDDSHLKLNKDRVDLAEWLRRIIIELYTEIEEKGFNHKINIPQEKVEIKIDTMKMKRVISNIVTNSMKYNPKGTTIYVECRKEDDRVEIFLGDDGVGIEEDIKSSIFDDFIRGDHEGKDGMGIGLAISKKIVSLHDGNITLEEDENYKTKFKISLYLSE